MRWTGLKLYFVAKKQWIAEVIREFHDLEILEIFLSVCYIKIVSRALVIMRGSIRGMRGISSHLGKCGQETFGHVLGIPLVRLDNSESLVSHYGAECDTEC